MSNLLVQGILQVDAMPNSDALDSSAPGPVASSAKRQCISKKTVPSKGKGKGKGKGQSNRKKKKTYCGTCNKEYKDTEDWVECSFCNEWFDRTCAGLADDSEWSRILDDDIDWECHDCKDN